MLTKKQVEDAKKAAAAYFEKAGIVIAAEEKERLEVADFGLGRLDEIGLELLTYVNTRKVCAKELVMTPWQICPEHRHPSVTVDGRHHDGKEETFRCRYGEVYLYVEGAPVDQARARARVPADKAGTFTVWHEIILYPGQQYTLYPDTKHWFQGGPNGAVVSEFSTTSRDESDIFTDPEIGRETVINDN